MYIKLETGKNTCLVCLIYSCMIKACFFTIYLGNSYLLCFHVLTYTELLSVLLLFLHGNVGWIWELIVSILDHCPFMQVYSFIS